MAQIYKLTLTKDVGEFKAGEVYIGQSNGKGKYYFTGGTIPRNIISKYGRKIFDRTIIYDGEANQPLLDELEKHYIQIHGSHRPITNKGFNWSSGGESSTGALGINSGEKHWKALPDSTIVDLLDKYATGNFTQDDLSKEFGVPQSSIAGIVSRKSRKYLNYDFSKINELNRKSIGHRGELNGRSTLNEELINLILKDYSTGRFSYRDLSVKYKVGFNSIGKLLRGETWKYLTSEVNMESFKKISENNIKRGFKVENIECPTGTVL